MVGNTCGLTGGLYTAMLLHRDANGSLRSVMATHLQHSSTHHSTAANNRMDFPLLTNPASSQDPTHRRVLDTAREGHPATLPAWVQVSAVEVDIEVPVVGPSGSTARPLEGG